MDTEQFVMSLVQRSKSFHHCMRNAGTDSSVVAEGDYSYSIDKLAGNGWLLIGVSLRVMGDDQSAAAESRCHPRPGQPCS